MLGDGCFQAQVVEQDVSALGEVGVVFRLGFLRFRRGDVLVLCLDFLEQLLALGLALGVLQAQLTLLDIRMLGAALVLVEADAGLGHQLLGQRQALAGEDEVRVAGGVAGLELGQERLVGIAVRAHGRLDAVPGHGLGQGALTDFLGVDDVRVGDVRQHALVLGALSGDAIELGQGQLQLAMVERLDTR